MRLIYIQATDILTISLQAGTGTVAPAPSHPSVELHVDAKGTVVAIRRLQASMLTDIDSVRALTGVRDQLTVEELEVEFGLAAATWRVLLNRKRVLGTKVGSVWTVSRADAEAYLASRRASGRPAKNARARQAVRPQALKRET
jgi:hypothetical protein